MENIRTILITGGTGFIGKALTQFLLDQGFVIKILTRHPERLSTHFHNKVTYLKWPEPEDIKILPVSYACDAIINLAGENIGSLRWNQKNKLKILESRIQSVEKLKQIINGLEQAPKVWIQASAIGYYGFNTHAPVDESAPKGSGFLAQVVDEWEKSLNNLTLGSIRKVNMRLGIIISLQGGFLQKMIKMANLGVAVCPGNGKQQMSWIHLEDLMEYIKRALINEEYSGKINLVTPYPLNLWNFTKLIRKNSSALFAMKIPGFVFKLLLGKEKTNEMLMANQEVTPAVLEKSKFPFKYQKLEQVLKK